MMNKDEIIRCINGFNRANKIMLYEKIRNLQKLKKKESSKIYYDLCNLYKIFLDKSSAREKKENVLFILKKRECFYKISKKNYE